MHGKLVILLACLCAARVIDCQQLVYGYNIHLSTYNCANQPDGIVEIGCDGYAECVAQKLVKTLCETSEMFDRNTRTCVPATGTASCSNYNICQNLADGKYADSSSHCETYYTCFANQFFGHNYCPAGLVFDQKNQICNWPQNVPFPCGTKTA